MFGVNSNKACQKVVISSRNGRLSLNLIGEASFLDVAAVVRYYRWISYNLSRRRVTAHINHPCRNISVVLRENALACCNPNDTLIGLISLYCFIFQALFDETIELDFCTVVDEKRSVVYHLNR